MKKPRKPSTKQEKGIRLERTSYVSPYGSPETLEHMKNCEAREWLRRFRTKVQQQGSVNAQSWWQQVCGDIEKKRGAEALADLRRRMNEERQRGRTK